jgi:hypothetical protein
MRIFKGLFLPFVFLWLIGLASGSKAQSSISFKIDGDNYTGTIQEAVLIKIGDDNYLQIKASRKDQLVFLYLKERVLKGELPVTLKYIEHNHETKQTPDAELVWAPGGGEQPPWNTIEGEAVITQYDPASKIISGTFEFVVEKQDVSMKKDQKKERLDIEEGRIDKIQYVVDAIK